MFTCTCGSYTLISFFNDLLNDVEFNDFSYVGLVVGPFKHIPRPRLSFLPPFKNGRDFVNLHLFQPLSFFLLTPLFSVSLRGFPDLPVDIIDASQYSIQQSKLRTEEDHRLKLAEEKK